MSLLPSASLSAATLAIYILVLPLVLFIAYKHGKHGILGWLFVAIFALIQITASGILVSQEQHPQANPSMAGPILATIGLSPLLLAVQGILHEIQLASTSRHKFNTMLYFLLHQIVLIGVILTALGASNALNPSKHLDPSQAHSPAEITQAEDSQTKNLSLWKAGAALLFLSWLIICASAITTCFAPEFSTSHAAYQGQGKLRVLMLAVLTALPFVGVRTIYGLVFAVTQDLSLGPTSGSMAVKVLLQLLPQLLAVLALVGGGWTSKDMRIESKEDRKSAREYNMVRV